MIRVRQLLCLVSPAVASSAALQWSAALAGSVGATLHVLSREGEAGVRDQALRTLRARLPDPSAMEIRRAAVPDEDACSAALQRYVAEAGIDLLVLDAPGSGGAVPPMAARPTKTVIEQLDRPTVVVSAETPARPSRILVTTDLSDRSFEALRHATALAALYDASIELIHVLDTSPYVALTPVDRLSLGRTTLSKRRARHRLKHFLAEGTLEDVPIHAHLVFGDPANRIAHVADERATDLLVLASHGRGGRTDRPLGGVADRVLRRVTCPVFLVRSSGRSLLPEQEAS